MRQIFTLAIGLSLTIVQPAHAQIFEDFLGPVTDSISDLTEEVIPGISNVRLGIGPAISPDYEGSDDYNVSAAPLISLRYRDLIQVDNNHISINILGSDKVIRSSNFKAGPSIDIEFGRNENDSPDLTGLGDVGTSFEFGGFVSYRVGPTRLRFRVRKDLASGHDGVEVISDFRILFYKGDYITIVTTLRGTWVNNSYMDSIFSITPEQSLASGLPAYNAEAGIKDYSLSIATNYQISDKWAVISNGGYQKLTGDAKDSPIVSLKGSSNQFIGGIFAVYSF